MVKKYYIPGLPEYVKSLTPEQRALSRIIDNNVVEIADEAARELIVAAIRNSEFVEDSEMKEYLGEHMPDLLRKLRRTPIDLQEFKELTHSIFTELPDEVFEGENIVDVLRRVINFVIRKHEIDFIITNIANRKLEFDDNYRYRRVYDFYYQLIKLSYDLEEYYRYFINMQLVLERVYLKSIEFGDKDSITRTELDALRHVFNLTGRNLVDFKAKLESMRAVIIAERTWLKRATIMPPSGYDAEEAAVLKIIDGILVDLNLRIEQTISRKKGVEAFIEKNKKFDFEKIRLLLDILQLGRGFL